MIIRLLTFFALQFIIACGFLSSGSSVLRAQQLPEEIALQWKQPRSIQVDSNQIFILNFAGASTCEEGFANFPVWKKSYTFSSGEQVEFLLTNEDYIPVNEEEANILQDYITFIQNTKALSSKIYQRKAGNIIEVIIFPFRKNLQTGSIEKLNAFTLSTTSRNIKKSTLSMADASFEKVQYPDSSILSHGVWKKMGVQQKGIYQLTYQDMVKMGFEMNKVKVSDIAVFGNGQGSLPENNADVKYTDLKESSIMVYDANKDGIFGSGDYILFYAPDVITWKLNTSSSRFEHSQNVYSDYNYFFITIDPTIGQKKRITTASTVNETANKTITTFNDYRLHEQELTNIMKSGRMWVGESFRTNNERKITSFTFPNITSESNISAEVSLVATSSGGASSFTLRATNASQKQYTLAKSSAGSATGIQATTAYDAFSFQAPANGNIDIFLTYTPFDYNSTGYLDYVALNATRNLKMYGNQMTFRSIESVGEGNVSEFILTGVSQACKIWDVTDINNIQEIPASFADNTLTFKAHTDSLREYVAFSSSQWFSPSQITTVENQNLHQLRDFDYVIYAYPAFKTQAERLAKIHHERHGLNVAIVYPTQVYNEFSGGKQDPLAIRWFMKMLYDQSDSSARPKYLLLFGDGSYDYKNRVAGNTNFIPTYQTPSNTFHPAETYVSDDFFGFLADDADGRAASDEILIGIGRLPAKNTQDAEIFVNKTEIYTSKQDLAKSLKEENIVSNLGNWRKTITMVADDQDADWEVDFTKNSEIFANTIQSLQNDFYVEKIYTDAFEQVSSPTGQSYPEPNRLLNRQLEKGTFLVNYTGHGGPKGWMSEQVLTLADIQKWKNKYNLPIFITATCSFFVYDDPDIVSAGEQILLNPSGGGIALFSTTRTTYEYANTAINSQLIANIFTPQQNNHTLGNVMMQAKNRITKSNSIRNVSLFGDPAIPILTPDYKIVTTKINEQETGNDADTIKAMMKVKIEGIIAGQDSSVVNSFNGILSVLIFDKATTAHTLGNDGIQEHIPYILQNRVLYRGSVEVQNGRFIIDFVVPKDIVYQFGMGKIYYYAYNDSSTASGAYENIIVGGYDPDAEQDNTPPKIKLYMNTTDFKSGGITNNSPTLLAFVSDDNGINASGSLGHDITATLDGNYAQKIILNDYYQSDFNSYKNGTIQYPFFNLSPGVHVLELKVWDVFDNSSKASITFVVKDPNELVIENLYNYPNPFTNKTYFTFECNQPGKMTDIQIQIYSLYGQLVRTLRYSTDEISGYQTPPLEWDGDNANGVRLAGGVYIYTATVQFEDGSKIRKSNKLIMQTNK